MAIQRLISNGGRGKQNKISHILVITVLAFSLVVTGAVSCKQAEETLEEEGVSIKEGAIEFEGSVKVALGKYLFIPKAQGFDIVVQGNMATGDVGMLVDKKVRGMGNFSPGKPSVLIADSIEVEEEGGVWTNVFTRSEEPVLDEYLDLKARGEFLPLLDLEYDKKDGWEGKERAKVYGKLEGEEGNYKITLLDFDDKQIGKIIVDNFSDFGKYYVKKLRLFDNFWFYITVKDTVDWQDRRRTREMFHADVLCAGLF